MENLFRKIVEVAPNSIVKENESMSNHTSFKVGGVADVFVDVNESDLNGIILAAKELNSPLTIIGNGSNLLVGDGGIRGIVVCIGRQMSGIAIDGNTIKAGAGELLSVISKSAAAKGLTGLEFASGIPGSLGGAVVMNAGAYGGQMADCLTKVTCLEIETGAEKTIPVEKCELSYRHSIFIDSKLIITSVEMLLKNGNKEEIHSKMEELAASRREKQPIEFPSAGSTFKRPKGHFAGKLIMDAGLKGFCVGGAYVSEKHAGFVINKGGATAKDIKTLMDIVEKKVFEKFGVHLEPEVRFVGEFI